MLVVCDTSPLTALITVHRADLLPQLFHEVVVPKAVEMELRRGHPSLPDWLQVLPVRNLAMAASYASLLDAGEAEAITLAEEINADRLLIDERKGRRVARERGLAVVGLLGVVLLAKHSRLIPSARTLLDALDREAGVYLHNDLKADALKSVRE